MAVNIKFDLTHNPEPPTLILANRNGNKLGQLDVNPKSVELVDKFNEASEVSFTVNKYVNGKITNLWDKLVDFKLIYCKEWDMWFECKVELDEDTESVKTVFCTQLGQAELSQIMLYDIEINTEADIERDDYKIGILYDPLDSQCILSRLLDKAPHYSIIHVDNTLANIQRSFSFDGTSIYDAFQEIAEEIGCLFVFNSDSDANGMPQRTISVYDLQQNCNNDDCKYRGEFTDKCPKCEGTDITYGYGEDTLIFVTSDELASEGIQLVTDTDSVKNCFKLEAGDDLMTATIRNRNPNGTDYIWYFSDATKEDMPDELVEKLDSYDEKYKHYYNTYESELDEILLNGDDSKGIIGYNDLVDKYLVYNDELEKINNPIKGFSSLMNAYYNTIDLGWYLKSGLMPKVSMGKTDAEEQADLLSMSLPPLIAVANLKTVSKATADSSVLMMAKAIVSSRYKVTIKSSSLSGSDWSGQFTITNYSDEEDTYTTSTISRTLTDWDETYIQQKIDKMLSKENTDDLSITGLFAKDYDDFCAELKKYALVPLTSFHDACQACLDILIEQGAGSSDNDLYNALYVPYYDKLKAIEAEMAIRESEVNIVLGTYDVNGNLLVEGLQTNIEDIKVQIQNELNFEKYLGEDLWMQFCAYRREDKYRNENYISDGLNNAELFQRALEFYEVAENEIFKSSELQHSITATLNNLLAIPKFKSLVESFEVGNWIRVQIDDSIYKLRLVEYEISYDDFDNISVRFSDVAKTKNGYSDLEDILSDASSMASSYDSIKRQANLGNEARDMIRQWLNEGLDASLVQIQNNTNEDIVIDNNGLVGRSYSDITEEYSPEQIRLTHNIIAFTNDNWKSVKQAIGKHKYKYYDDGKDEFVDAIGYGMSADFLVGGVVQGSQIISGDVYSDNYSKANGTGSYINLRDGTFDFGGGRVTFNGEEVSISSPDLMTADQVTKITNDTIKTTNVLAENLQVKAANIDGTLTADKIDTSQIVVGGNVGSDLETLLNNVANSSITKVDVLYGQNQSTTTPPTTWSTDAPAWQNGWYIWTKTQTTAGGEVTETDPVCITGAKGDKGSTGDTGADGLGISKIEEQYYLSTSNTSKPSSTSSSWSTDQPAWEKNKYIWTRSKITWEDDTVTYTDAVLAKAINGANETANIAKEVADAEALKLGALTAEQNGVTYINGAKILTGSIGAVQIAASSITADKLAVGAITAEKVNVGWQSGNCATGWTSDNMSYINITSDNNYNYNPKITMSSSYTSGNIDVNGIPFYASAGDVLRFGGRAYKKSSGDNGVYLKYSSKSDGVYSVVSYQNTANSSTESIIDIDKSYTVTQAGWYMITVAFNTQTSGAYVTNIYCYKDVKGEMIVNGRISSVDKQTYFDLDTGEVALKASNGDFVANFASSKLEYTKDTTLIGGIEGVTYESINRLAIYSPSIVNIGVGNDASSAAGAGLYISKDDVGSTLPIYALNGLYTKNIWSDGLIEFSGEDRSEFIRLNRSFADTNNAFKNYSAQLNLGITGFTDRQGNKQVASFHLNSSYNSNENTYMYFSHDFYEAKGCLYFAKGDSSNRSADLALGATDIWFNGNSLINSSSEKYKTDIAVYDDKALNVVNDSKIYTYKYISDLKRANGVKTKYGLIIERECPAEIIDNSGDAISIYSMCSILWKAVQELSDKVNELEENLNERNT